MPDETRPSFLRRAARVTLNTALTLAVIGGAGYAVFTGAGLLAERAEATNVTEEAALTPVSTRILALADGYTLDRSFVGQVEAAASVEVSFEIGGRLAEILVEEGGRIEKDAPIARLDTALLEAERTRLQAARDATAAQLEFAESRLTRALALQSDGFAPQERVDQARASRDELTSRLAENEAGLATVTLNLEKSVIYAPFTGQIGRQNVDGGETLAAGAPVVTLIETAAPQVRIGLPLSLDPMDLTETEVQIAGNSYPARLTQVRPDIDPTTRTRTALFAVDGAPALAFGQTATLVVQTIVPEPGTWVPLDALREGARGVWQVLVLDGPTVRTASVEVLHADGTRVYVRGTFAPGTPMIDTGAHRVVPGQTVRPVDDLTAGLAQ